MKHPILWVACLCFFIAAGNFYAAAQTSADKFAVQELNLSSPELTWTLFTRALAAGDYDLARKCCCPEQVATVRKYRKLGKLKTRRLLGSVRAIQKVHQDGKTAKYMVIRDIHGTNLTTYVYFTKTDDRWTITSY